MEKSEDKKASYKLTIEQLNRGLESVTGKVVFNQTQRSEEDRVKLAKLVEATKDLNPFSTTLTDGEKKSIIERARLDAMYYYNIVMSIERGGENEHTSH